jgi:hypothetical protein
MDGDAIVINVTQTELGEEVGGDDLERPRLDWRYWKVEDVEAHPPMPSERRGVDGIGGSTVNCGGHGVSPLLLVLLGEEERRGGRDVGEEGSQLGMLWSRDKDEERGGSHGGGRCGAGGGGPRQEELTLSA